MKRARDVRDQLEGLMERVEIELTSNPLDNIAIRKVPPTPYTARIMSGQCRVFTSHNKTVVTHS